MQTCLCGRDESRPYHLCRFFLAGESYWLLCGGATFRKSDGKVIGETLVNESPALTALIFKYLTEVEYTAQVLYNKYRLGAIPMPEAAPYVTKDGVVFQYDLDDGITMERWGGPSVTIPIKEIYPYLTDDGKELLK